MIWRFFLLSVVVFLFVPPLHADFTVIEETDSRLILEFNLPDRPIDSDLLSPTTALVGIPPDFVPEVTVLDSESERLSSLPDGIKVSERLYRLEPLGFLRHQRIARLVVFPVYRGNGVELLRRAVFQILFPSESYASAPSLNLHDDFFRSVYNSSLINPHQSERWRSRIKEARSYNVTSTPVPEKSVKAKLSREGIYRITQRDLARIGVDTTLIDPRTIKLICQGEQKSIWVEGDGDGSFDPGDAIIFYGQPITKNRFTEDNVYWITWGGLEGIRAVQKGGGIEHPEAHTPQAFKTFEHYEKDVIHDELVEVASETTDHFFWTGLNGTSSKNNTKFFSIELPYAVRIDREAIFRARFQGASYNNNAMHSVSLTINSVPTLEGKWLRQNEFLGETKFPQKFGLSNDNSVLITAHDENGTPENEYDFYLDWIEIEYWRTFVAEQGVLKFSSDIEPAVMGPAIFRIDGFTSPDVHFYQVSESGLIAKIENTTSEQNGDGYVAVMEDTVLGINKYFAVQENRYEKPDKLWLDKPSSLRNPNNSYDYIIISHSDFIEAINKLAEYRENQGLRVIVVDVEDVYDEFSYGIFNPLAIKVFLRYAFFNWTKAPTYVLLVGDATYDYKNAVKKYYQSIGEYKDITPIFVPTYHGRSPVSGETAMDQRFVEVNGDDKLPDMFLGRFPVQHPSEVDEIIEKIIEYENNPSDSHWQSRIMQIADDELTHAGDEEFERSRERLFNEFIPVGYDPVKIYLRVIGSPMKTNQMIIDEMNKGVVIAEYSGHGGMWSWADESIFRGDDIQKLSNQGRYPFLITTTCLNGFFDKPLEIGGRCLSEEFLIQRQKGAIAVLSASRLTFAYANSAFDRSLFTHMFQVDPPILGAIVNRAKVDFIGNELDQWIIGAEQYILFGDPALRMNIPRYNIKTELDSYSVGTSRNLTIRRNSVLDKSGRKVDWFNADIEAVLTYPNNLDDIPTNDIDPVVKRVTSWNGEFGDIIFEISPKSISGEGIVRLKAMSDKNEYAIGGTRFKVHYPVILDVYHQVDTISNTIKIFAVVQDDKGFDGIDSVTCSWFLTTDFRDHVVKMSLNKDGIYETDEPIDLPDTGYSMHYQVTVSDTEGRKTESFEKTVPAPRGVNLAVSWNSDATYHDIGYQYSNEIGAWIVWCSLENSGDTPVTSDVLVIFYDGDPDSDGDGIADTDAIVLGKAMLPVEVWVKGSNVLQRAKVEVPIQKPLNSGVHDIYAWVDPELPEYNDEDKVKGLIREPSYMDNLGWRTFAVNDYILGVEDVAASSLDNVLRLDVPKDSVSEQTNLSITATEMNHSEQPSLFPAPMPIPRGNHAFRLELRSATSKILKPLKISMKYDIEKLRNNIIEKLGFGANLTELEKNQVEQEMQKWVDHLALFKWNPNYLAWVELDSTVDGEKQLQVSAPIHENSFTKTLQYSQLRVDSFVTPVGDWILLFLGGDRYIVLLRREGESSFERVEGWGRINDIFKNDLLGLEISLFGYENITPSFGDTLMFSTKAEMSDSVYVTGLRNRNQGDGELIITPTESNSLPEMLGDWVVIFADEDTYMIYDENGDPLRYMNGDLVIGRIDRPLNLRHIGASINIIPNSTPFSTGDKFIFRTCLAGEVKSEISELGLYTIMHGMDDTPPSIKLWVNGEPIKDGSVIPPRPEISILLEDQNMVDLSTFRFFVKSEVNGKQSGFVEITPDQYNATWQGNIVPIRYEPILYIGKYTFRFACKDTCGNPIRSDGEEFIETTFYVEEQPDLEPPRIRYYANGEEIQDGSTIDKQPHLVMIIEDDHGLNPRTLSFKFARGSEEPQEIDPKDYRFDFSKAQPGQAMLFFEPDCPNGEYKIVVGIDDTSKNELRSELRFNVEEKVSLESLINVPNPIRKDTVFHYYLTQQPRDVRIKIYTTTGRLIREIEHASAQRKYNETYWDCTDKNGDLVANGIYLYKIIVQTDEGNIEKIGKLAVLR